MSSELGIPNRAVVVLLGDDLAVIEFDATSPCMPDELSDAEQDVAELIVLGASNEDIAVERGVHVRTISKQVESVFRKLGVGSRAEMIVELLREKSA